MTISERVGDRQSEQKGPAAPSCATRQSTALGNSSAHIEKASQNSQNHVNIHKLSRELTPRVNTARLNRQIRELKGDVTYRKQKGATCLNRQRNHKGPYAFLLLIYSAQNPPRSLNAPTENKF